MVLYRAYSSNVSFSTMMYCIYSLRGKHSLSLSNIFSFNKFWYIYIMNSAVHIGLYTKQGLMADRETLLTESGCNGERESADWLVNLRGYDKKSQEFEYKEWKHLIPFRTIPKYDLQICTDYVVLCSSL